MVGIPGSAGMVTRVVWGQGQCKLGQGRLILLSGSMRSALCRQMLEVLLSAENNKQTHTPSFLFPSQIRSNHLLLFLLLFFRPFSGNYV